MWLFAIGLFTGKMPSANRIQTFFYRIFDIAPFGQILLYVERVENVCAFAVSSRYPDIHFHHRTLK